MVIFLIGFMGSGKSWWCEQLAAALRVPAIDLDREIEAMEGMEIPDIFQAKGETYFRERERACLEAVVAGLATPPGAGGWQAVIACGGGTPCFFDTIDWMNQQGITVWLDPPVHQLAERLITETASRPLLAGRTGADLVELIEHLTEERKPYYQKARIHIKNTHLALDQFVNQLEHASHLP